MKTLHTIYTNFAKRLVMLLIILITIGIGSAWGEDYELVTTITDGEYVIGAVKGSAGNNTTIYAINSTDGTSWKSATETTPSNGKISNPSSSIVWTLTKTGDNSFTLKNGSIYLTIATTTGSGSVRSNSTSPGTIYFASTGSNSTFEISGVNTFTVSSGNQVGYNIGNGYRQYAQRGHSTATSSGSISTQFRFYKKTASTFTVTCQSNSSSYGTVSQASVTNVANNTSISSNGNKLTIGSTIVTATPKEQDANYTYAFSNWSGIPAGGKVTADVTVTANFTRTARALTNYRTSCTTETVVTLDPNGGAGGTPPVTATKGEAMPTITPPTRTGYTFQGYFTEASGGTQYYNANGTSAKDWDKTDETFTLYAQWECAAPTNVKITGEYIRFEGDDIVLTVSGDNIATDAIYEWKKGDQVINNQTTTTLTINNCTISDAGNYTCTVSNGTCSASNNYTVKMYRLRGLTDPENSWTTDFVFSKAEGKTATYEITLNGGSNYKFKVHDGSAYYGNNEGGDNPNPTMTHDNCTNWTMQENKGYNVILQTTITGTYIFTLDYTDESNPTISVTYPQKTTVYLTPMSGDTGPYYAIHTWKGNEQEDVFMTKIDDCGGRNIYKAEINASHTNLIFVSTKVSTTTDMWNQKNYQTIDLTYPTDNNKMLFDLSKIYLTPNSNWNVNNARFAAYFFGNGETWVSMNKVEGETNLYEVAIPTNKDYPNVIFCRMNPSTTTNNWDNTWNQTNDLTLTTDGKRHNHYTVEYGAWSKGNGTWDGYWTTYTPNHTVTFDANGHGTVPEDQCITDGGKATNPGNLSAIGYTFGGWYKEVGCTNAWDFANDVVTEDIILYAKWIANTNTAYTVKHYQENIDGTYPATPTDTDNLTGTTATSVTPAVKDYLGFTAPSTQTVTIAADGSTVVEYKYTRISYTLTWNLAGGEITKAGTTAGSVKFGAPLTAPTVTKSGLTFIGWEPVVPATMPAANATYTAIWENCIWVETSIDDINEEDVVVVTMTNTLGTYALNSSGETTSAPPATSVTVTNKEITSSIQDAIMWSIGKDGDNLIFHPITDPSKNLYCNTSNDNNNRVRVGNSSTGNAFVTHKFIIEGSYLKNAITSHYIGIYLSSGIPQDWRGYTSTTNIPSQTLKFYKRVCLPEGQYWVKWMVNGQEYTVGNPTTMVTDGQIKAIPTTPADNAIGDCADTFMGWSESNLGSAEGQSAPTDLFTTLAEAQELTITENKTFYAVFATAEAGQSSTESIFSEDFSSISKGDNTTTSGSGNSWDKNDNFYSVSNVYQAGGAVRLGKSNEVGYLVTKQLTAAIGETLTISFTVKGWSSVEGNIQVSGNNSEFTQPSAISYTSTMSGSFETKSVSVVLTKANPYIKIATTEKRAFIDDIQITKTTSPAPTYSNYVTNCCALAPATNLTVSGTTAISATLTWTAPSPTTGITKLQVRNAETDAIVVDNIAVNTTTATITGLTECTSYQYYVVSVGDCEVVSNTVTATPFSGAKTVNYDYNGGSGSPASFTTNCINQTITLPVANRDGYTFKGWYTAATGGTRVGDANDTYDPATSPITLYAQWTIKQYTVTWNPNGGNWNGSTSNIVQTYEYGAAINKPDDPTRENGIFKGWSPEPTSTMPAVNKTYTAQWEMVYTLTFVDMNIGGITRTQTQQSSGESIVAPTANSEVCDMWTFIGWAPSNSLNGGTDKPADFIAAGETILGSQITANKTYYSVYSYNSDNTQEFEIGKSGTYLMYAISGTTKYYATTARTGGFYGNPETAFATYGYPSKFKLTYNKTENKYIIYHENTTSGKESSGYFELNTSNGDVDVKSETPSLFTIQAGSNGAFIIRTDYNTSPRSFGYDGNFTDYSGDNPIYFEPASEIQYYNAANCGEVDTYTMSFHNPFGDENALIWYDAEHEESYYTDKPLNTSIDVFPTMVYNGWAFIGWTANQQYNELIGEDNLDDENSATDNPASSFTIYSNTTGWAYTLNSNVTMYPVFTKYEDNEDIDLGSGGEYYMYFYREGDYYKDDYFGADNHYQRMYALAGGGDNGEFGYTTNCNNAQIFEFIKEGDGWNIRVKNADGSYPTKSYLVNTSGNDYDLVATKPSSTWSITKEAEGDFTMWYRGNTANSESDVYYQAKAREYAGGSSWNFKCYNQDNNASQYYYKVYLGTCENRVFSSNPTNKPAITLSGEPIVTSTQDQSIRAQGELSISATKLAANGTITLTSDNADVYFSTVKDANFTQATKPVTPLTLYADEKGKLAMTPVYVHYKPTSTSSLGVQTANITATTGTNGQPDYATATTTAALRNLPATFAIVAKVGNVWYALPSQGLNSTTPPAAYPVEVDNMADPTAVTNIPDNADWSLRQVYTSSGSNDRFADYGENLVFVNNASPAMTLNASSSGNYLLTDAQYNNYYSTNPGLYEWTPTTTDLETYQLTNEQRSRRLSVNTATVFGVHAQDKAVEQVRFLPIQNRYTPAALQVVEWKENSVVIMYNGDPAQTASVSVNGAAAQNTTLSAAERDIAVYELTADGLAANPTQRLSITIGTEKVILSIPYIISGAQTDYDLLPGSSVSAKREAAKIADLIVLNAATLTAAGVQSDPYKFRHVTIYGGGKLVIPSEKGFGVASITLRAGGITDAGEYDYVYPQFELRGTFTNSAAKINYDYITDYEHWYHLVLPFAGDLGTIKYPTEFYGANVAANNKGSWQIKRYAGEIRATGNYDAWKDIETEGATSTTAGQGYIFWGAPKKVSVNGGDTQRQKWGIQRITMSVTGPNVMTAENGDKAISELSSYATVEGNSGKDNDQGWNLIGNPYMVNLTDMATTGLHACKLVEVIDPATGKWNGQWEWNDETNIRYLTIPSEHFDTYTAKTVNQAVPLVAGCAFFVQLEGEANAITFAAANRASLMPALRAANGKPVDIETGIILSNEILQDEVNFWIKDGKTNDYEYNADYPKTPNNNQFNIYGVHTNGDLSWVATGPEYAAESMPIGYQVPAAGTYMLSLSEIYNSDGLDALYVTDHALSPEVTVDIMSEPYEFSVNQAETNNERFTVSVRVKAKTENGATGLGNVGADGEQIHKFIYQDKMYILHHGIIYDATGKRVITINK